MTVYDVTALGACSALVVGLLGVVGVSLWVLMDRRIGAGRRPVPPWWWDHWDW